jgi:stage III sporulation protein AB
MWWAGTACAVGATGGWGWLLARRLRRRPEELAALAAALEALRSEIAYGRTPLPEALERVGSGGPVAVRLLFGGAAARLRGGSGLSAGEAWAAALADADASSALDPEDLVVLSRVGARLGGSDAEDQDRLLALAADGLRAREAEARRGLEPRARMCLYLGLLAGAAVALSLGR